MRVGETKSPSKPGKHAKSVPARVAHGDGRETTEGGSGAKGNAHGSPTLKGNRNKGRTKSGGRAPKTNSDLSRSLTRDAVFAMHPQRRSPL